jgi:signal transduction histidine kinase
MSDRFDDSETALIWAPIGRDAALAASALGRAGLSSRECSSVDELCSTIAAQQASVAIIAEEALGPDQINRLRSTLQQQPPWSDLPFIVLTSGGTSTEASLRRYYRVRELSNIILLERPIRIVTLIVAAQSALASRRRQYQLRDYLLERERAEQTLLRQAEDLALSNSDLRQFAYVASHDLQEPIRNVHAYSELLERRYRGALDEHGRTFLEFIIAGAKRMQALIDDLLVYSRVTQSQTAEPKPVSLNAAWAWAIGNLSSAIEEADAMIACPDLPTVCGIQTQLGQVFQNILSNALRYRRPDVPLQVEVTVTRNEREWVICIQDNGQGFEPAYAEGIFGMFKRLHGRDIAGTGMGLAICKRIVERHGGRIWAEGKPNEGAIFYIALPVMTSAALPEG